MEANLSSQKVSKARWISELSKAAKELDFNPHFIDEKLKHDALQASSIGFANPGSPVVEWFSHIEGSTAENRRKRIDLIVPYVISFLLEPVIEDGVAFAAMDGGKVVGAVYLRIPGKVFSSPKEKEALMKKVGPPPQALHIEEWGPELLSRFASMKNLGHTTTKLVEPLNSNFVYLLGINVVPEYRGKGIASKIIKTTLKAADAMGYPVYLEAEDENLERYYQSFGFKTLLKKNIANEDCLLKKEIPFMIYQSGSTKYRLEIPDS